MPLYILTAEILAIHIRANLAIKGLCLPQSTPDVKLSQYANDTTLLLNDTTSIHHTFNTLDLYQRASGAKVNQEKCKGLWSGSLKNRSDSIMNFEWFNNYIPDKILGHIFGNVDCTHRNLQPCIQKVQNTVEAWRHRDLSYKGKVLVINGLLTSTLWYSATSIHMPQWAITEIEQLVYNLFWDNKQPLVTCDTLALPTAEGSHSIHHLQPKIEVLRLNTLQGLLNPEPAHWKTFTAHFLHVSNMLLGTDTLATTYSLQQINTDIPIYHQELLRTWAKHQHHRTRINLPTSCSNILQKPLFHSELIQCNGKPIYFKNWIAPGVTQIQDLCYIAIPGLLPVRAIHELLAQPDNVSQTLLKTTKEFQEIIQALPPNWLQIISNQVHPTPTTFPTLLYHFKYHTWTTPHSY